MTSQQEGKIPPWWLCMSAEARDEAREAVRALLATYTGRASLTLSEAEEIADRGVPDDLLQLWRDAERAARDARNRGNSRAFFT